MQNREKGLLRFLTCGSVDDGKSTLIGNLLYNSKKLCRDQIETLKNDSKKYGSVDDGIDYALLMDGLASEREQNITIDQSKQVGTVNVHVDSKEHDAISGFVAQGLRIKFTSGPETDWRIPAAISIVATGEFNT